MAQSSSAEDIPSRNYSHGVSVVIVTYNAKSYVAACLEKLKVISPIQQIIVVDNGSSDRTAELIKEKFPDVELVEKLTNLGFPAAVNIGVRHSKCDTLLILDSDVVVENEVVDALFRELDEKPGVVGPAIYNAEANVPDTGSNLDLMMLGRVNSTKHLPLFVQGCCIMTTRACFDIVGGYDERFFLIQDDVEYCWQVLRHGFDVRVIDYVSVWHKGGASTPGGYRKGSQLETSSKRIILRERNSYTMLLSCAPLRHMIWLLPLSLVRSSLFSAYLFSNGYIRAAFQLWVEIFRNVGWLRGTISRRRHSREFATNGGWSRIEKQFYIVDNIRERTHLTLRD